MEHKLQLVVHGRGNAWPVPLGETHPFYDRGDPLDLSNAAFSLVSSKSGAITADVLVDAGHGTIQSLITGSNRIPDCICLTHGHMDHTLSVDWVVQSYWRRHNKERRYPIYSTLPVYQFLTQSYPHLEALVDYRELEYGVSIPLEQSGPLSLTAFPVYHGQSAFGASMLLFETEDQRVLFTGDLLSPLLRKEDYKRLIGVDLLVVDTNNRFPWPRTNHWSFAGHPEHPMERSEALESFLKELKWEEMTAPHKLATSGRCNRDYFNELREEWYIPDQAFTLLEFLQKVEPARVMPVHYSGAEDLKYYSKAILTPGELSSWIRKTSLSAGLRSNFTVPGPGDVLDI